MSEPSLLAKMSGSYTKVLQRIFLFLFVLLFILVIADLPVGTSVPPIVWIPLAAIGVVLIFCLVRTVRGGRNMSLVLAGFVIIAILAVGASQFFASTPPIEGPNSIAVLEKVNLGGREQWITIRGKDRDKPVLLYLGIGGPGAGGFPASAMTLKPLEDHFVVVNWDQPGTGKSYGAAPIPTLTVEDFVSDAHELTQLLRERFHQDKIYVMGLSWGTILGTKLVHQYPGLYHAYIGTGQMVNTTENDRLGYEIALKAAADAGDTATENVLRRNGPPPYTGEGLAMKYAAYNNVLFEIMGSAKLEMVILLVPQFAREYGLVDKVNFGRGLVQSFTVVYPQLQDLDFTTQAPVLDLPVYFLVGRQDINAMAPLVEGYYNMLQAPHKELIWLDSGHGAGPEDLLDALVNRVLPQTQPPQ